MELQELQKHWDAFGKTDPLWAILSFPEKRHGNWDIAEFFEIGRVQVEGLMSNIASRRIEFARGKALDFGCGVGRLTQSLAEHFDVCFGVDIAPSMIEQARRFNRHGERCQYVLNEADDLSVFEDNTFDFIYTSIVLQHMEPRYSLSYLKEFLRVLAPGGLLVFQLPSERAPVEVFTTEGKTACLAPLPDSAFRAELTAIDPLTTIPAGSGASLRVRVKNAGDTTWPAYGTPEGRYFTTLGNRWFDAEHRLVESRDPRVLLPRDVEPGMEVEMLLAIEAPQVPGRYFVELDMSHEWVCWFQEKGSRTTTLALDVEPAPERQAETFRPTIEMHFVKKSEVVQFLEKNGGEVLDIEIIQKGKLPYLDYDYYVRKPKRPVLWSFRKWWRRASFKARAAG